MTEELTPEAAEKVARVAALRSTRLPRDLEPVPRRVASSYRKSAQALVEQNAGLVRTLAALILREGGEVELAGRELQEIDVERVRFVERPSPLVGHRRLAVEIDDPRRRLEVVPE